MDDVEDLLLEMTYTTWADSCKDPTIDHDGRTRECRRGARHEGWHASGTTRDTLVVWPDQPLTDGQAV